MRGYETRDLYRLHMSAGAVGHTVCSPVVQRGSVAPLGLFLCLLACPADPTDGPDASPRDLGRFGPPSRDLGADLGQIETGPTEVGPDIGLDGGSDGGSDGGLRCEGQLRVTPERILFPGGRGTEAIFSLVNEGPGVACLQEVSVRLADDSGPHESFVFPRCGANRCPLGVVLCDPQDPNCSAPGLELRLGYPNPDRSPRDEGLVRVRASDGSVDVPVLASDAPCGTPTARPVVEASPAVGGSVLADGRQSDPGGDGVVDFFFWRFTRAPGAAPAIVSQGSGVMTFVPTATGAHALGLTVTNDCGQTSGEVEAVFSVQSP